METFFETQCINIIIMTSLIDTTIGEIRRKKSCNISFNDASQTPARKIVQDRHEFNGLSF